MPRYYRKKNYNSYRKRRYRRPGITTYGAMKHLAYKAYNGVRYLKSLVNAEKQYKDQAVINTTLDSTGSVTLLSGIAQGDDTGNRTGNSVLLKTLYLQMVAYRAAANATQVNYGRIIIVKDLENTGTAPTVADFFQNTGANMIIEPLNVDHTPRYQVLKDIRLTLLKTQTDGKILTCFKKFGSSTHLKFTGPNIGDVYKNAIYLIAVGDQASGSNPPVLTVNTRLGYYDN